MFKGKESPLTLDWNRVRVFDREVGQMFVNLVKTSREAQVFIIIYLEWERVNRPHGFTQVSQPEFEPNLSEYLC